MSDSAIPWTAAHQASLSSTNSWSLLRLMSIETVMPSNHLILCLPLLPHLQFFPASGSFQMSQFFESGGQSTGVVASPSVLPMNNQGWFPLELTGLISLQSKGFFSRLQTGNPLICFEGGRAGIFVNSSNEHHTHTHRAHLSPPQRRSARYHPVPAASQSQGSLD